MSAFKIRHIKTGKFLSTTASSRYMSLYMSSEYKIFPLEKALVKNGRVIQPKDFILVYEYYPLKWERTDRILEIKWRY